MSNVPTVKAGEAGAAGEEELDIGGTLGSLFSVLSSGYKVYDYFFGSHGPSLAELIEKLPQQLKEIFRDELAYEDIRKSQAAAAAAVKFLDEDFYTYLKDGTRTKAQLYEILAKGEGVNYLTDLEEKIELTGSWAENATRDLKMQSITVYLALAGVIMTLYQERAKQSPDDSERTIISNRASSYASAARALLESALKTRQDAVQGIYENYKFYDTWVTDDPVFTGLYWHDQPDGPGFRGARNALQGIYDLHRSMLATGSETDYAKMKALLFDKWLLDSGMSWNNPNTGEHRDQWYYRDHFFGSVREFGSWYAKNMEALTRLERLIDHPRPDLEPQTPLPNIVFSFNMDGSVTPPSGTKKILAPVPDSIFHPVFMMEKIFNDQPGYTEKWAWGYTYYPDQTMEVAYGRWRPEYSSLGDMALISQRIKFDKDNRGQMASVTGYDISNPSDYISADARFTLD